jgi:hypothetical protein
MESAREYEDRLWRYVGYGAWFLLIFGPSIAIAIAQYVYLGRLYPSVLIPEINHFAFIIGAVNGEAVALFWLKYAALAAVVYFLAALLLVHILSKDRRDRLG